MFGSSGAEEVSADSFQPALAIVCTTVLASTSKTSIVKSPSATEMISLAKRRCHWARTWVASPCTLESGYYSYV